MWLCTQFGFFSIVQKRPGEFHVRARVRRDLENLAGLGGSAWEIIETADADYRFRIVVDQRAVAAILAQLAERIDYANFKGRIHSLPDQAEKGPAYGKLWGNLLALQEG
ncbi:MAG: hypothetical protein IT577_00470 [Verrucomicrobiae bacterium]|nr:hypothetical protein [Verrucomicrobiae bacterium]